MAEWLRRWRSNHSRFVFGFESHQRRKFRKFGRCIKNFQNTTKKHPKYKESVKVTKNKNSQWRMGRELFLRPLRNPVRTTLGYCYVTWTFTPLRLLVSSKWFVFKFELILESVCGRTQILHNCHKKCWKNVYEWIFKLDDLNNNHNPCIIVVHHHS